jgi:hypothetical protein
MITYIVSLVILKQALMRVYLIYLFLSNKQKSRVR